MCAEYTPSSTGSNHLQEAVAFCKSLDPLPGGDIGGFGTIRNGKDMLSWHGFSASFACIGKTSTGPTIQLTAWTKNHLRVSIP